MRFLLFLMPVILCAVNAFGQQEVIDKSYKLIKSNKLEEAHQNLKPFLEEDTANTSANVWYLGAFVNKELYKNASPGQEQSYRSNAYNYTRNCKHNSNNPSLTKDCNGIQEYLNTTLYNDGVEAYNGKNHNKALKFFDKFLRYASEDEENYGHAHFYSGLILAGKGKTAQGLDHLDKAEKSGYNEGNLYYKKAKILAQNQDSSQALKTIDQGLKVNTEHKNLHYAGINLTMESGNYEKAEQYIQNFLDFDPDNTDVLEVAGTLYEKLMKKYPNKASQYRQDRRNVYKQILTKNPDHYNANYNLGISYYNEAVNIINNQSYDTQIKSLQHVVDTCQQLFHEALPYIKKANDMNKNKNTLTALEGIYYNLDTEKADSIKRVIEKMGTR